MTDQEIVQWLHDEKKIDVGRSTVTTIKNQVEKHAEEWYIELRESGVKYIAIYKERLDSLLSYQKKLNEIIATRSESYPEIAIRAISELHRIEMSLYTLFKETPVLEVKPDNKDYNAIKNCKCTDIITHCKCKHCKVVWCPTEKGQDWCPNPDCLQGIKGCEFQPWDERNTWVQCATCDMWFKRKEILNAHHCAGFSTKRIPPVVGDEDIIESPAWANLKAETDNVNHNDPPKKEQPLLETETETETKEEPIGRPWTKAEAYRAAAKANKNKSQYLSF